MPLNLIGLLLLAAFTGCSCRSSPVLLGWVRLQLLPGVVVSYYPVGFQEVRPKRIASFRSLKLRVLRSR